LVNFQDSIDIHRWIITDRIYAVGGLLRLRPSNPPTAVTFAIPLRFP
jgi:hypothetical protein